MTVLRTKAPFKSHKTKRMALKNIDVDVGIAPVVEWLNSFPAVTTRWSCQGEPDRQQPYVMFTCEDAVTLIRILSEFDGYGSCDVSWLQEAVCLRYSLRFSTTEQLAVFIENLKRSERSR